MGSRKQSTGLTELAACVSAVACAVSKTDPGRLGHIMLCTGAVGAFDRLLRAYEPCPGLKVPQPCWVPGALLQAALKVVGETSGSLEFTAEHLLLKSGTFRARLPLLWAPDTGEVLGSEEGEWVFKAPTKGFAARATRQALLEGIAALLPLVVVKGLAAHPWSHGVHIAREAVYAARNIGVGRYRLPAPLPGWPGPGLTVPPAFCTELLRREEPPDGLQVALGADGVPCACTAYRWAQGAPGPAGWLQTALVTGPWPDSVEGFFYPEPAIKAKEYVEVPEGFAQRIAGLAPFAPSGVPAVIRFKGGAGMSVHGAQGEELATQQGTWAGLCEGGFRADILQHALSHALRVCWGRYPRAYWDGGANSPIAGVFIGTNA